MQVVLPRKANSTRDLDGLLDGFRCRLAGTGFGCRYRDIGCRVTRSKASTPTPRAHEPIELRRNNQLVVPRLLEGADGFAELLA